jgi:subtilisin family serine protease
MKLILIVFAILIQSIALAECETRPIVIAVIDTGFGRGFPGEETAKLCQYGHKDFSGYDIYENKFHTKDLVPVDSHGHGTHIAGLIDKYAKLGTENYCLVILKYEDPWRASMIFHPFEKDYKIKNTIAAINYARNIGADYINYSSGGDGTLNDEIIAVKKYIDAGGKFVAAAGNEHSDLAKNPYYPAVDDDRVIVVGSINQNGKRAKYSNYGSRVNRWEIGTAVEVYENRMSGTSQAAAIATGKLVSQTKNICK